MPGKWVYPIDPDCPAVERFYRVLYEDPMSEGAPLDDISEDFEKKHRAKCRHCQEYGLANVDVEY